MQYISPIRFFEHLDISTNNVSDVKKLKKIVNLEFLSAETGIVNIEGFDYNKQDLLALLSDESFEQNRRFHLDIWNNKFLLDVLERESVDIKNLREILAFKDKPDFCRFVSPYFAKPFSDIAKVLLNEQYIRDVYLWLQCHYYIDKADEEVAYESLRRYFEDAFYLFRNLDKANYDQKKSSIELWVSKDWASVLNALPDYLFPYRDGVVEGLTHVLVIIQYKEQYLCYTISSWLVNVNIATPHLSDTVKKNHGVFSQNASAFASNTKSGSFWSQRWVYFVGAILVKIIIGMGICNSHSSDIKVQDVYNQPNVVTYAPNMVSDAVPGDSASKIKERENVYANVYFEQIASKYYHAYQGAYITDHVGLSNKSFGELPIYLCLFEGKEQFLQPFKIENKTHKDLDFIYMQYSNQVKVQIPKGKFLYCDPNENQSVDFLFALQDTTQGKEMIFKTFALNGAQSIALSVGKEGEINQVDRTNRILVDSVSQEGKQYKLTLTLSEKSDGYHFQTKGKDTYYLTKK